MKRGFFKLLIFLCSINLAFGAGKIAITFDDGPRGRITEEILDVLKENNVKATFFILGENGKRYPKILKRMKEDGHQISNHSYSHPNLKKMKMEDVKKQLQQTQNIIYNTTGERNKYYRPPYGAISKEQKEEIKKSLGLTSVMWNICPVDWDKKVTTDYISKFLIENAKNRGIILLHDYKKTAEAIKIAIPEIKKKGYEFVTVEELYKK